jgi:hypothetical protein
MSFTVIGRIDLIVVTVLDGFTRHPVQDFLALLIPMIAIPQQILEVNPAVRTNEVKRNLLLVQKLNQERP